MGQDKAQSPGAVVHTGRNRKGLTGCASLKARDASGRLNKRPGNSIIGSQGLGETVSLRPPGSGLGAGSLAEPGTEDGSGSRTQQLQLPETRGAVLVTP